MSFNPFKIEVLRGTQVESVHTVIASIFQRSSNSWESYGDDERAISPRSSIKPFQTLPLLLTNAAQQFQLGSEELALACASHTGETCHTSRIQNWMHKIGVNESNLECGTHPPSHMETLYQLLKNQSLPSSIHNNCSGKHVGMLTTAIHMHEPIKNYVSQNHPVQQRIQHYIKTLCQLDLSSTAYGIDGCSIPTPFIPIKKLAAGFCEFIDPIHLSSQESDACQKIFSAFVEHPLLTAGTGRYCTEMMKETQGHVLLKGGAEGVMTGAIPQLKVGFALKALDGNSRASEFCTSVLLNRFGLLPSSSTFLKPKIYNWSQIETGFIRLSPS